MIAYVKGTLTFILDQTVIVDVNGIGYEIHCANPFAFAHQMNEEVFIYTYQHVREDANILYGFKTEDEKYLFTKLISVSGIGPKSGLAILAGANVVDFVTAVEQENEKFLTQFPGVGKKTARQIILDLKGKLSGFISIMESDAEITLHGSDMLKDVEDTLKALGYTDREIKAIMPKLQKEEAASVDELIKKALALFVKS